MRLLLLQLSLGFLPLSGANAQDIDSTLRQLYLQQGPYTLLEVDALGNAYVLTPTEELRKFTPAGQLQFNYHNTVLGHPASLDVSDPFNLLLFYPEQQTIVLLDRTLNERSQLDLRETSVQNAVAIARSHDNQLWVFDDFSGRLYKMDNQGNINVTSDDLRLAEQLMHGPTLMGRWEDRLLLHFEDRGIAIFTFFGQLESWLPLQKVQDWQLRNGSFLLQQPSGYSHYQAERQLLASLPLSWPTGMLRLRQSAKRLYILTTNGDLQVLDLVPK